MLVPFLASRIPARQSLADTIVFSPVTGKFAVRKRSSVATNSWVSIFLNAVIGLTRADLEIRDEDRAGICVVDRTNSAHGIIAHHTRYISLGVICSTWHEIRARWLHNPSREKVCGVIRPVNAVFDSDREVRRGRLIGPGTIDLHCIATAADLEWPHDPQANQVSRWPWRSAATHSDEWNIRCVCKHRINVRPLDVALLAIESHAGR